MQVPESLGDKEVVILDFTIKVLRRNIEDGLSSVEVEVHSVCFGNIGLPWRVVKVSVEWMDSIAPCLLKSFNGSEVLFLPQCDHQILVFDNPSISKDHFIIVWIDLINTYVVWLCVVLAESLPGWATKIEFSDSKWGERYDPVS